MSEKLNKIIEELKTLTLLEASELVTEIEKVFGVDTSVSAGMPMMMAPTAAAPAEAEAGHRAQATQEGTGRAVRLVSTSTSAVPSCLWQLKRHARTWMARAAEVPVPRMGSISST